jgi:hypothetical protein
MDKPKVGDIVRLNDHGMDTVCGLRSAEMARQAQRMTITHVTPESLTQPEKTWGIDVDQPLIGRFLLSQWDVDLVERPAKPATFPPPRRALSLEEAIALGVATKKGNVITIG